MTIHSNGHQSPNSFYSLLWKYLYINTCAPASRVTQHLRLGGDFILPLNALFFLRANHSFVQGLSPTSLLPILSNKLTKFPLFCEIDNVIECRFLLVVRLFCGMSDESAAGNVELRPIDTTVAVSVLVVVVVEILDVGDTAGKSSKIITSSVVLSDDEALHEAGEI